MFRWDKVAPEMRMKAGLRRSPPVGRAWDVGWACRHVEEGYVGYVLEFGSQASQFGGCTYILPRVRDMQTGRRQKQNKSLPLPEVGASILKCTSSWVAHASFNMKNRSSALW